MRLALPDEALAWIERELGGDALVDVGLRGGETLRLGTGQRWEVLALPGHTTGHIGAWHADERIALVIDAVLGNGVRDRAGNLLIPPRIYDLPGYRHTISQLQALAPERLLGAHFPPMDRAEAAGFLDLCDAFCDDAVRVTRATAAGGEPSLHDVVAALDEELGPYPDFVGRAGRDRPQRARDHLRRALALTRRAQAPQGTAGGRDVRRERRALHIADFVSAWMSGRAGGP